MILPSLVIAPSPRGGKGGRGVFATENIDVDTILEISPVIVLSATERKAIEETKLYHYIFEWGKTRKQGCVALGYVSMYNHDYSANCEYEMDFEESTISVKAIKPIKKGEELCINYNADPEDKTPVWFHL